MSDEINDRNKVWQTEDLRRYISGEMTAGEMHAIEMASLEDPMLADALEGMRETKPDLPADMAVLRKRLAERSGRKAAPVISWRKPLQIAASVIILLSLSGLGYLLINRSGTPKNIAVSKGQPKGTAESETALPPPPTANDDSVPATDQKLKQAETTSGDKRQEPQGDAVPGSGKSRKKTEKPAAAEALQPEQDEAGKRDEMLMEKKDAARVEERPPAANEARVEPNGNPAPSAVTSAPAPKSGAAPADQLQGWVAGLDAARARSVAREAEEDFSGKVLDEKGQPVTGVLVQMGKTQAVTDGQGYFRLSVSTNKTSKLDFRSVGYEPVVLIPDSGHRSGMLVTLRPALASLAEVAVTGYSSKKSKQEPGTAKPAPGWKNYRSYLSANKSTPTIDSSLHGTEKVSFTVTRNGIPVDFNIDQSLSPEHDSVMVRMIRNGPRWKPEKDTSRRVSLALPY